MREYITAPVLANRIQMIVTAKGDNQAILLVEGKSDRKAYWRLIDDIASIEPGDGKEVTVEAIRILSFDRKIENVRGLIDADFDRILEVRYPDAYFLTDSHDLECELIRSGAFERFVEEYCSIPKCTGCFGEAASNNVALTEAIRQESLAIALQIGCLRLVSQKEELGLDFKGLNYSKFISADKLELNAAKLVEIVLAHGAPRSVKPKDLINKLQLEIGLAHSRWQVSQGHDLAAIISIGLKKRWGNHNLDVVEIERVLRLAYAKEYFYSTEMYSAISKWAALFKSRSS